MPELLVLAFALVLVRPVVVVAGVVPVRRRGRLRRRAGASTGRSPHAVFPRPRPQRLMNPWSRRAVSAARRRLTGAPRSVASRSPPPWGAARWRCRASSWSGCVCRDREDLTPGPSSSTRARVASSCRSSGALVVRRALPGPPSGRRTAQGPDPGGRHGNAASVAAMPKAAPTPSRRGHGNDRCFASSCPFRSPPGPRTLEHSTVGVRRSSHRDRLRSAPSSADRLVRSQPLRGCRHRRPASSARPRSSEHRVRAASSPAWRVGWP